LEPIKELEGKRIAIIGLGASQIDYVIGKENSEEWDEVWVINSALSVFECDRVFMLDPASRFLDTDDAGNSLADRMAKLFPNKVYRVPHDKYKDANEFLMNGDSDDLKWAALKPQ